MAATKGLISNYGTNFLPQIGSSIKKPSNIFSSAIEQSAEDYDKIMKGYEELKQPKTIDPLQFTPITPKYSEYMRNPELDTALGEAKSFANTGGYSSGGLAAIRERGISPIRSLYANSMRNLQRQKTLQGGYSPNYTASMAKLSRDLAEQIGSRTTDVNARIAEMQAEGKRAGLAAYLPMVERESTREAETKRSNIEAENRANELNLARQMEVEQMNRAAKEREDQRQAELLRSMQSLYGTTPALAALFGQQALAAENQEMQRRQLEEQKKKRRAQTGMDLVNNFRGGTSFLG